ncbi:MAG TPA: 4Fe-4S dicluster domain-containing protein [Kamptonema sp.]|nr:4Fe-4S dicluster domain-containing protein [Kamptonema sp.]
MGKLFNELKQDILYQHGMNACLNCGVCTAVCPAAEFNDYSPREVMNICQSESDDWIEELLKSEKIWFCGQCFSCKTRCPRGNSTASVILALRRLSVRHGYFAESEKGRQQLFAKRVFGENVLKRGYTLLAENISPAHFPELGENWEYYYEHREELRAWWDVPMDLENSPGSHRVIPEKDMEELRAIYQATGAMELMDAVEKGMEKKLGSKEEVEKYWQNWLETGDSRNYEIEENK